MPDLQERFEEFDAAHPDVYDLFCRFARELAVAGRRRFGAKAIMERVRWHYATSSGGGGEFKVNNSFTSRYVRKFLKDHPDFGGFFETRRLRAHDGGEEAGGD